MMVGETAPVQPPSSDAMRLGELFEPTIRDEIVTCEGYLRRTHRTVLYYLLCFLSLGILWYFTRVLFKHLYVRLSKKRCGLAIADTVVIKDFRGQIHVVKVKTMTIEEQAYTNTTVLQYNSDKNNTSDNPSMLLVSYRAFEFQKLRYVYEPSEDKFVIQRLDIMQILNSPSTSTRQGLDSTTHRTRLILFGTNFIDIKAGSKKLKIILEQLLQPYMLLQCVLVVMWFAQTQPYHVYATLVVVAIVAALSLATWFHTQSQKTMKKLAQSFGKEMRVVRDGISFMAGSAGLVPGDVVEITGRVTLPCDFVLISGELQVDESPLTGDLTPVVKTAYKSAPHSLTSNNSNNNNNNSFGNKPVPAVEQANILIGGSRVISIADSGDSDNNSERDPVYAVVIRTGFNTSKGVMLRNVLLAQQTVHPYMRDSETFSYMLIGFVLLALVYTLVKYYFYRHTLSKLFGWSEVVDLALIIAPASLPFTKLFAVFVAQRKLKKRETESPYPSSVMTFGIVDCVCYDKTGTLTEVALDVFGVIQTRPKSSNNTAASLSTESAFVVSSGSSREFYRNGGSGGSGIEVEMESSMLAMSDGIITVMAACHNLHTVNNDSRQVLGDPLDALLFSQSAYELRRERNEDRFIVQPPQYFHERGIIGVSQVFPFSATLKRMSVVTQFPMLAGYAKGAPQAIKSLCRTDSLPDDYDAVYQHYASLGYRVIAMAHKPLLEYTSPSTSTSQQQQQQQQQFQRSEIESEMYFIGFILLKNKLRPETIGEIAQLKQAQIRTIMITGDNGYTAAAVAKECGMIAAHSRVLIASIEQPSQSQPTQPLIEWNEIKAALVSDTSDSNSELVMTGAVFDVLRRVGSDVQRAMYYKLLVRCDIFADFDPGQKALLLQDLKRLQYVTAMCGDGSNDSHAFTEAHVSLSLVDTQSALKNTMMASTSDSMNGGDSNRNSRRLSRGFGRIDGKSVATAADLTNVNFGDTLSFVATFTTEKGHCICQLINDGRTVLRGLSQGFQLIVLYTFMLYGVMLFRDYTLPSEGELVYLMVLVAILIFLLSWVTSDQRIRQQRPAKRLLTATMLASVCGQLVIQWAFQVVVLQMLWREHWYLPQTIYARLADNSVILFVTLNFQLWGLALTMLTAGKSPSRIIAEKVPIVGMILTLLVNVWITFPIGLPHSILTSFGLRPALFDPHMSDRIRFRALCVPVFVCNILITYLYEIALVSAASRMNSDRRWRDSFLLYKRIQSMIPSLTPLSQYKPPTRKRKKHRSSKRQSSDDVNV